MSNLIIREDKIIKINNDDNYKIDLDEIYKININEIKEIVINEDEYKNIKRCSLFGCKDFNILKKLDNITNLYLDNCENVILPENLNKLEIIQIFSTNITIPETLKNIKILDLCSSDEVILPNEMSNLKKLCICECVEKNIIPNIMNNLEYLEITNSNIKKLPEKLDNLKYIKLWETYNIEYIPKCYKSLKFIDVDENIQLSKELKDNSLYVRYKKNNKTHIIINDDISFINYNDYIKDFDTDEIIENFIN